MDVEPIYKSGKVVEAHFVNLTLSATGLGDKDHVQHESSPKRQADRL